LLLNNESTNAQTIGVGTITFAEDETLEQLQEKLAQATE
jgi:hypothetical protein